MTPSGATCSAVLRAALVVERSRRLPEIRSRRTVAAIRGANAAAPGAIPDQPVTIATGASSRWARTELRGWTRGPRRLADRAVRDEPSPPARPGASDAGVAGRGRRRRPGVVGSPGPGRLGSGQPRRVADDGGGPPVPRPAQVAPGPARGGDRRAPGRVRRRRRARSRVTRAHGGVGGRGAARGAGAAAADGAGRLRAP